MAQKQQQPSSAQAKCHYRNKVEASDPAFVERQLTNVMIKCAADNFAALKVFIGIYCPYIAARRNTAPEPLLATFYLLDSRQQMIRAWASAYEVASEMFVDYLSNGYEAKTRASALCAWLKANAEKAGLPYDTKFHAWTETWSPSDTSVQHLPRTMERVSEALAVFGPQLVHMDQIELPLAQGTKIIRPKRVDQ